MSESDERREIEDLYNRYAWAIDESRYEDWLKCFTEDGVFESPKFGHHVGQAALRRFTVVHHESIGAAKVRHVSTNIVVDIDGDEADGMSYLTYFLSRHGKSELAAVGYYKDKLKKVGGRWLFASRKVFIDGR